MIITHLLLWDCSLAFCLSDVLFQVQGVLMSALQLLRDAVDLLACLGLSRDLVVACCLDICDAGALVSHAPSHSLVLLTQACDPEL
jgi:hypothetical protein